MRSMQLYPLRKRKQKCRTMRTIPFHISRSLLLLALCVGVNGAQATAGEKTQISRTTEKELHVVLSATFGSVTITKGAPEKMFIAESAGEREKTSALQTDYIVRNRIGYLDVSLGGATAEDSRRTRSVRISNFSGGTWRLSFTDAVPISFDIELGVAKGRFDLSGLMVKDFNLSCGASDVVVSFDTPNPLTMEEINIEAGVSTLEARSLGNANFKRFRFEGGVGAATLDFSGSIASEVDVDVKIGVGVCTIVIPRGLGVRVFADETFISRLDLDRSFRTEGEGQFVSENFKTSDGRMNLRIEAGLGNVKVRRQ